MIDYTLQLATKTNAGILAVPTANQGLGMITKQWIKGCSLRSISIEMGIHLLSTSPSLSPSPSKKRGKIIKKRGYRPS